MLRQQLLDTSRGRIVTLLQRGALTVDDIAAELGLTANAIRAQIAAMERDGLVRRSGRRPGTTRPFHVFELTPEVEQLLSQAYLPLLTQLVQVFANALPMDQVETLMRTVGRGLASEVPAERRPAGSLRSRVSAASDWMNEHLGAVTQFQGNGGYTIRGSGCPLAALTGKHPAVCLAMESLLTELLNADVTECCDRAERPTCCFKIAPIKIDASAFQCGQQNNESSGKRDSDADKIRYLRPLPLDNPQPRQGARDVDAAIGRIGPASKARIYPSQGQCEANQGENSCDRPPRRARAPEPKPRTRNIRRSPALQRP